MNKNIREKYNHTISKILKKRLYLNTHMNITDNTYLQIENCKRILDYNDIYIRIQTSTLTLQVWGKDLHISDYNTDGIIIEGVFSSVEFE